LSISPVLFVFLDGVGLADPGAENPFSSTALRGLRELVGGPLVAGCGSSSRTRMVRAVDACLGVDGLPQSATGQTTLFSGVNAAREIGRHVAAYPGPLLKQVLERANLFAAARERGRDVAFANAFDPQYLDQLRHGKRRVSATVFACQRAGVELRETRQLGDGTALTWDFARDLVRPERVSIWRKSLFSTT
jgi:2,3-bisphosphoglycerate-independent phosphoglycerate mutase